MKTIILAGGLGTRLSEETILKPKPMVEIGEFPIIWHIMKIYEKYNVNEFVVALGYKGDVIKNYFSNYFHQKNDFKVNLLTGKIDYLNNVTPNWDINLIDTGLNTLTGLRLFKLRDILKGQGTFMLTYGDGLSDINIGKLLEFHKSHGKIATVTAVRPPVRFGELVINNTQVTDFAEKPQISDGWINGGFFVFEKDIFNYLDENNVMLEREPLEKLVSDNQLMAYKHTGFWQCMDTLRDKEYLQKIWESDNVKWLK